MPDTLNLGDLDSAQNEIPPPQQFIANVNHRLIETATGYRVAVGDFLLQIVMKRSNIKFSAEQFGILGVEMGSSMSE